MYLMKDNHPDRRKVFESRPYPSNPNLVLTKAAWLVFCQTCIILLRQGYGNLTKIEKCNTNCWTVPYDCIYSHDSPLHLTSDTTVTLAENDLYQQTPQWASVDSQRHGSSWQQLQYGHVACWHWHCVHTCQNTDFNDNQMPFYSSPSIMMFSAA
jgi:hypothetical protein